MNMDETAAKLLGLGQRGWATPKQDGRVRFIGAADKRNLTISTVVTMTGTIMAQLIVEGTTKRVVQDLPQHEKLSYTFSESHWCTESTCQELIEWLGAWVRKQGFLHWVLLWDCASVHRKASLLEWIRTAHPECHVLFIPGGYTAELQPADIAIQQPLKLGDDFRFVSVFCAELGSTADTCGASVYEAFWKYFWVVQTGAETVESPQLVLPLCLC